MYLVIVTVQLTERHFYINSAPQPALMPGGKYTAHAPGGPYISEMKNPTWRFWNDHLNNLQRRELKPSWTLPGSLANQNNVSPMAPAGKHSKRRLNI